MNRIILVLCFLVCISVLAGAQGPCYRDSPDGLSVALTNAKSCKAAVTMFDDCAWGSSADAGFGSIAIDKCQKTFLGKFSPAEIARYDEEVHLCNYEYERQRGTMYISADYLCIADVAARFAADPALAKTPTPRASFNCAQAKIPMQKAICADGSLGRADIVLSRVYDTELKAAKEADQTTLRQNEQQWIEGLPNECGFSSLPASQKTLNCLRISFELRFRALDTCGVDDDDFGACMESDGDDEPVSADGIGPAASFNCDAPSTTMEKAICADDDLGQSDIWLASVYHDAEKAMSVAHRREFVESERKWLSFANQSCTIGVADASLSPRMRACVYDALNARAEQLKRCAKKSSQERMPCLNQFQLFDKK